MDNDSHSNSDNPSRNWNILNWNIRGLNSEDKCNAIKEKIEESACAIYCIQETKRDQLDHSFIKKLAPKRFNKFAFSPSEGSSGGILMGWNSSIFFGEVIQINKFAVTVKFTSTHNGQTWSLISIYRPHQGPDRDDFVYWLNNLQLDADENWMLAGDFNFYRSSSNRNREGGNMHDIMIFNEIISNLDLLEIPLKGRKFTWSNMRNGPLLEQIDWVFPTSNWTSDFPNTLLLPMARPTSDHIPCRIQIGTSIPKAQIFRFENFWVDHLGFFYLVQSVSNSNVNAPNSASRIIAKFKLLRAALKKWRKGLSNLSKLIRNCNSVLATLDAFEEKRPLFIQEFNFRNILKNHIAKLLKSKKEYWKQ